MSNTINLGTPQIPAVVSREDLNEALQPLCTLLGVHPMDWYDDPGIVISRGKVGFLLAAGLDGVEQPTGQVRRSSVKASADTGTIRPREHSELGVYVTVDVAMIPPAGANQ